MLRVCGVTTAIGVSGRLTAPIATPYSRADAIVCGDMVI